MSLTSCTCTELRSMLRNRHLKTSGTKAELIERLHSDRENEISTLRQELREIKKTLKRTKKEFVEIYQAELNHDGYDKPHFYMRIGMVLILAAYIITSARLLEMRDHVDGIQDLFHILTEPISDWLEEHAAVRSIVLITHAILMDALCALVIFHGLFYDDTLRMQVAMISFYTMRNVCQNVMRFPLPEKWRFYTPGLPSILISYDESSDFYFSGHVGAVVMSAFEFHRKEWYTFSKCLWVFAGVIAFVVITTRAHYTVDVIDGILFAILAVRFAHNYTRHIDHFVAKIGNVLGLKSTRGQDGVDDEKIFETVRRAKYVRSGYTVW